MAEILAAAVALHRAGRVPEALALYERALAATPDDAELLHLCGLAHLQAGRADKARDLISAALRHDPRLPSAQLNLGVALERLGRADEALAAFARAEGDDPNMAEAPFNRANALMSLGRWPEAVTAYERALHLRPAYDEARVNRANALRAAGRRKEAIAAYEALVAAHPLNADLHLNLGATCLEEGQWIGAGQAFRRAARLSPRDPNPRRLEGRAAEALGRTAEALALYEEARRLAPAAPEASMAAASLLGATGRPGEGCALLRRHLTREGPEVRILTLLGALERARGRPEAALSAYGRALALDGGVYEALFNRGNLLLDLGRRAEAIADFDAAIRAAPTRPEAYANRGGARVHADPLAAIADLDAALRLRPADPDALNTRANARRLLGDDEGALNDYDAALGLRPDFLAALEGKGLALLETGRLREAEALFEAVLDRAPERVRALHSLAEVRTFAPGDPHLARMEVMVQGAQGLPAGDRTLLLFALAKARTDVGEVEGGFTLYLEANALERARLVYDESAALREIAEAASAFPAPLSVATPHAGDQGPVFIVGLPRSGSTLLEQALAAHPQFRGLGETSDFAAALAALAPEAVASPERQARLSPATLAALGADYLARARRRAPGTSRLLDKSLDNIMRLGLILKAVPGARALYVRRRPEDLCLSCFTKLFQGDLPYAYDLGELGRRHNAVARLADHWLRAAPTEVVMSVDYEDLVADFEGSLRSILTFLGAPFDPACLAFHTLSRPVRTASAAQVRQPLFATSVGRSARIGAALEPLRAALRSP